MVSAIGILLQGPVLTRADPQTQTFEAASTPSALEYWQTTGTVKYPTLAKLAMCVFTGKAPSAASECLLSQSSMFSAYRREPDITSKCWEDGAGPRWACTCARRIPQSMGCIAGVYEGSHVEEAPSHAAYYPMCDRMCGKCQQCIDAAESDDGWD